MIMLNETKDYQTFFLEDLADAFWNSIVQFALQNGGEVIQ